MPTSTEVQLNSCRRCGSEAVLHEQKMLPTEDHDREFIVVCSCCIQKTEWCRLKYEAELQWNSSNRSRSTLPK
jgi:hypothetical protein